MIQGELTCSRRDVGQHHTQQSIFYDKPVSYLSTVFPYPPSPLHKIFSADEMDGTVLPSHVVLFESLLDVREGDTSVAEALEGRGYSEAWAMWNGFDWAQDEEGRRGGVRLWARGGRTGDAFS
jgi:phosphatidylinositol glycan class B